LIFVLVFVDEDPTRGGQAGTMIETKMGTDEDRDEDGDDDRDEDVGFLTWSYF